jgi:hypothetical protein
MTTLEYSSFKIKFSYDDNTFLVKTQLEIFLENNSWKDSDWKMNVVVEEYYIKTKATCITHL